MERRRNTCALQPHPVNLREWPHARPGNGSFFYWILANARSARQQHVAGAAGGEKHEIVFDPRLGSAFTAISLVAEPQRNVPIKFCYFC